MLLHIPTAEIEALAEDIIANFDQHVIEVAIDHQERAVWRSEPKEEGKWRRVERAIRVRAMKTRAG